jgi:hypothetical protein
LEIYRGVKMGLVSFFDLEKIKSENDCKIFVETGTYKGEGVDYALRFGFDKIYSIEIFDELAEKAQKRFKNVPNVEIVHNNSVDGLISIMDKLDSNCVFWLDAHFPGSDIGAKDYDEEKDEKLNMPLLEELKLIAARGHKDVILVDDLRTFKEVPQEFKSRVNGFNEHMASIGQSHVTKERLVSFDLEKELDILFPNKKIQEWWTDCGYLSIK